MDLLGQSSFGLDFQIFHLGGIYLLFRKIYVRLLGVATTGYQVPTGPEMEQIRRQTKSLKHSILQRRLR